MSIIVVVVSLKDKEPKVHIEHFFNIESLENVGYIIKAHIMLCGIHHFFEDPKVVVPKLICKFWRIANVCRNVVIGGYFASKVLGIPMKLTTESIAQAIGCEQRGTKFINI